MVLSRIFTRSPLTCTAAWSQETSVGPSMMLPWMVTSLASMRKPAGMIWFLMTVPAVVIVRGPVYF